MITYPTYHSIVWRANPLLYPYIRVTIFNHYNKNLTNKVMKSSFYNFDRLIGYELIEYDKSLYNSHTFIIYYIKTHDPLPYLPDEAVMFNNPLQTQNIQFANIYNKTFLTPLTTDDFESFRNDPAYPEFLESIPIVCGCRFVDPYTFHWSML